MANLSFFLFPCALGTLLFTLFARTSQACTLTAPDPAVGITYGVHFDLFWDNCTTRGTIQLWSQNTGGEDKQLNEYSVTRSPIPWAISNIGFIYLTVYFVLVDHDGLKATSPTYVIQPGPQIGSLLSASPSALSGRTDVVGGSLADLCDFGEHRFNLIPVRKWFDNVVGYCNHHHHKPTTSIYFPLPVQHRLFIRQ
ncbi:uncharacterized protein EI90DRAFT_3013672 [Cantharellus anzutake]|uniref:uncharacterized protein n=1 Tax=Cantharellus anzutake TaxID=1750568 RepID=UPI0019068628|nr:uncharacterized protein EI90DRAFT_3013672 [Cantharellus anzutake]KAF8337457.1 hypothetical protein EI90DRAFT_3013672 [Cantharellus anzutake]